MEFSLVVSVASNVPFANPAKLAKSIQILKMKKRTFRYPDTGHVNML
jgi:hypothetical protein